MGVILSLSRKEKLFLDLINSGHLEVSKDGMVFNTKTNRYIQHIGNKGYFLISHLFDKIMTIQVHRLIWIYFNGPIPKNMVINHIDGNKGNNNIDNLEIVTPKENAEHASRLVLIKRLPGEKHHLSRFKDSEVSKFREMYKNNECSIKDISKITNVHIVTVKDMLFGKTYGHIKNKVVVKNEKDIAKNNINKNKFSVDEITKMKKDGLSDHKIAKILNSSRATIQRFRVNNNINHYYITQTIREFK